MGIFDNRFTRWMNRNRKTEENESFKFMYEITAKMRDQKRGLINVKIKVPANNKKQARQYFEENIQLTVEKIVQDRRNPRRKNHIRSAGSSKYHG